jgi:hypothetical protein
MNLKIKKIGYAINVIKNVFMDAMDQKNKIVLKKIGLFLDL